MNLKTAWILIGVGASVLLGATVDRFYPDTGPAIIQTGFFVLKVIAHLHG